MPRYDYGPAPAERIMTKYTPEFRELRAPKIPFPYRNYTPREEPSISPFGGTIAAKSIKPPIDIAPEILKRGQARSVEKQRTRPRTRKDFNPAIKDDPGRTAAHIARPRTRAAKETRA